MDYFGQEKSGPMVSSSVVWTGLKSFTILYDNIIKYDTIRDKILEGENFGEFGKFVLKHQNFLVQFLNPAP